MSDLDERAATHLARMGYEREMAQQSGSIDQGFDACGPPTWDRSSWEAFKNQYGFYPYSANELPPTFEGAPDWVWELMKLRKPPVTVTLGSGGIG